MTHRGIALIRVSTEEQANEAEGRAGVLRQRHDIRTISETWDIELAETIEMVDVSGTSVLESSDFLRMLELLSQPTIDCLVISSLDRLVRPNDFKAFSIYDTFLRHRKLIFIPTGPVDVGQDPGFIQVLIGGMFAGLERKVMLQRIQTAKEENRKRGRHTGGKITLPRGIDFNFKTGEWSWVEPHAGRIRQAFSEVLEGCSVRSVAKRLGYLHPGALGRHLRNPVWIGLREYKYRCSGEKYAANNGKQARRRKVLRDEPLRIPIKITPLVSQEDFFKVQEILSAKTKEWRSGLSEESRFELTGIVRCSCGQRLYSNSRHKTFDYYTCRSRQLKAGCLQKPVKREDLEYTVHAFVRDVLAQPTIIRSLINNGTERQDESVDQQKQLLEQAHSEITRLQTERRKLLTMAVKGLFSEEQIDSEARRIDNDIAGWNASLRSAEKIVRTSAALSVEAISAAVASVFAEFEFLSKKERKSLLRRFFSAIWVNNGAITKATIKVPAKDSRK